MNFLAAIGWVLSKNWFIYAPKPKLFSFAWSIGIKHPADYYNNQNISSADPASLFRFSTDIDFMFLFTVYQLQLYQRRKKNNKQLRKSYLSRQGSEFARWLLRSNYYHNKEINIYLHEVIYFNEIIITHLFLC